MAKPSAKQLAARRAFAARYGGKKSRRSGATGTPKMARFARTRRYAAAARRGVSRSRRAGSGRSYSPIIDGALAGIAAPFASKWLGSYGTPAALIGVGLFRRNPTLTTLGAFQVTANTVASTGFMGISAPASGGWL